MKFFLLLTLIMISFCCVMAFELYQENNIKVLIDSKKLKEFNLNKITTKREKKGETIIEAWKGIKLIDVFNKYELKKAQNFEITAEDRYQIILKREDLIKYDPIIAISRDYIDLEEDQYRIVAQNLPDLMWISKIKKIIPIEINIPEPAQIYTIKSIASQIRHISDPGSYTGVSGFSLEEIAFLFNNSTSLIYARIVSNDGIEQILRFNDYLREGYLIFDNDKLNIQSPNMPRGMWLKDILFLHLGKISIVFNNNLDKENIKYKDFIKQISQKQRTAITREGDYIITDWDNIDWEVINWIE